MAYDLNDLVTVEQLKKSAQKTTAMGAAIEEKFNNKIASVYSYKGSVAFATLTNAMLIAANVGNVYNITDDFTTTADFVEGAGKKHTAGTNVSIAETVAPIYGESSDTSVDAEKTYYISRNGGYATVTPAGTETPSEEGWYEMTTPGTYKFDVHAGDLSNVQVLAVPTAANNIALLNASGQVTDSTVAIATNSEVDEMLAEVFNA